MMLTKESKIRVLENFYAIDYTLFGKPVSKLKAECCNQLIDEYTSIKGAMLSIIIELHKLVNHRPKLINERIDVRELKSRARKYARVSRENAQKLVTSSKGRADIKAELRESIIKSKEKINIEQMVQDKIREKAFRLALDNLLIARTITESENFKIMNEWEGKIIEDAYKILRDSLVEQALMIMDND